MAEKSVFRIALVAVLFLVSSPHLSFCRSLPHLDTSAPEPEVEASNATYSILDANLIFENHAPSVSEGAAADSSRGCEHRERSIFEQWMMMGERKRRNAADEGTTNSTEAGQKTAGELIMENNEALPEEISGMLVEMDIVNTPEVMQVREGNQPPQPGTGLQDREHARREERAGVKHASYLWPNRSIPYVFRDDLSDRGRRDLEDAMKEWMQYTCITFKPKTEEDFNYVLIVPQEACYSYVGMQDVGEQKLSVGSIDASFCRAKGVLLHELGHAIGFWHEQSRPDRDDYVIIVYENIQDGQTSQFRKYSREYIDSLDVPYDYSSIMHYPENAFSKNLEPTIIAKNHVDLTLGQKFRLSPYDILQANLLYECPGTAQPNTTHDEYQPGNHTFLIHNKMTSTCLTNAPYRDPAPFRYSYEALYPVSLVTCDPTSPTQRWQWTEHGTLLHTATLLCLTLFFDYDFYDFFPVLGPCKTLDFTQEWSCDQDLIKQVDIGACATAVPNWLPQKRARVAAERAERSTSQEPTYSGKREGAHSIEGLAEELEEMLSRLEKVKLLEHRQQQITLTASSTKTLEGHTENGDEIASTMSTTLDGSHSLTIAECEPKDDYQKWSIMSYQSSDELPDEGSLCSAKDIEQFHLRRCYVEDMEFLTFVSYSLKGWAACTRVGSYINGFGHTPNWHNDNHPDAGLISGLRCCYGDSALSSLILDPSDEICFESDWWSEKSDIILTGGWFTCPRGYFLKGLLLSSRYFFPDKQIIEKAQCCKAASAPDRYMYCYKTNMTRVADTGMHRCHSDEFLVTELHRHSCNSRGRMCEEEITCCTQV